MAGFSHSQLGRLLEDCCDTEHCKFLHIFASVRFNCAYCSCALWTGRPGHSQWADFQQLGKSNLGCENDVPRVEISEWDAVADIL